MVCKQNGSYIYPDRDKCATMAPHLLFTDGKTSFIVVCSARQSAEAKII